VVELDVEVDDGLVVDELEFCFDDCGFGGVDDEWEC